jgi:hypothetical protein
LWILVALLVSGSAGATHARPGAWAQPPPPRTALRLAQHGSDIGREGAASAARRATGGRVLSVSPEDRRGQRVYRVKVLLPEGRVRVVRVDARTGDLLY